MAARIGPDSTNSGIPYDYGVPLQGALAQRERLADKYDIEFGKERIFPELLEALLAEVPQDAEVLEVGAATGYLTRPLLEHARALTALEPSAGLLRRLLSSDVSASDKLRVRQGMVEDLDPSAMYDVAVVTFTPRRGLGLLRLLIELVMRVRDRVVMLLDEDGTLDWAYLARAAAKKGLSVRLRIVCGQGPDTASGAIRHAVVLVVEKGRVCAQERALTDIEPTGWMTDVRHITVPYPPPRATASALVRDVLAGGDRAVTIATEPKGMNRLYGNLRTAIHRNARDRLTVRRDGNMILVVRLPEAQEIHRPQQS
ncbi:MAG: hypothetical protein RBS78_01120 [Coriobacteriia bacterium]|jgi:hypothetical protein|nr:hypothetical protein [Coriobacteriia bacterium]